MKCRICGYEISETDVKCPGCDTPVEELKQANNITSNNTVGVEPIVSETPASVEESVPVVAPDVAPANTPVVETSAPVENVTTEEPVQAAPVADTVASETPVAETPVAETPVTPTSDTASASDVVIEAPVDSNVALDAAVTAETKEEPKKEKKKGGVGRVILVLFLLVILAAAGGCGYFFFVYGKPSAVLSRAMNSALAVTQSNERYVNVKANLEVTNDGISKYSIDSKVDLTNLASDTTVSFGSVEDKYVSIINDNEDSYIKFNGINDSTFEFENSLLYEKLNYSNYVPYVTHMNNVKSIISELKNVLPKVIDESKLTREFTTVTVDQKNMGSTKFGYKLDQTETNKLMLNLASEFKKNTTIMNSLMSIYTITQDDASNLIDNFVQNLSLNGFEFNLYTDYLTSKYYMAEVIVKGNNNVKLVVKFNENNKVNSLSVNVGSDQFDFTNNFKHIEVLRTVEGKVSKYVLDLAYTTIPSLQITVPDMPTLYEGFGKEALEAIIVTDKDVTNAYNFIVKDANLVYVAPVTEPSVDGQTVEPATNAPTTTDTTNTTNTTTDTTNTTNSNNNQD